MTAKRKPARKAHEKATETPKEQTDELQKEAHEQAREAAQEAVIVVRCMRRSGIWRAGRKWGPEETAVPRSELTDEQLAALRAEPLLEVKG